MKRRGDWREALDRYVTDAHKLKFEFGKFDCTQFAINCEKRLLGITYFIEFDQTYKTSAEGHKILTDLGYASMFDFISTRKPEITERQARRGDWVGHITQAGESLGVYAGKHGYWAADIKHGLQLCPIDDIKKVWRV